MRRSRSLRPALALALLLWGGAAGAQVVTDAAGLRELGVRLLQGGEPERAVELAQALIARDPRDVDALLLLGRAAIEAGDWEAALGASRAAHGLAEGPRRYLAARIAARAHAEMGEWTRAQFWLRRARGDAPDAQALRDLGREFAAVRALNPLRVSLGFGIAPSSNVNNGTSSETVLVWVPLFGGGYIETTPTGDALPLSGWRLSANATLSYRVAGDAGRGTYIEAQAAGRTYILSEEAQETAPDAEGSDYSDVQASLSVVHRWRGEGASGPSSVRLTFGRSWYDSEPYTRFVQGSWDRGFALGEDDRLDLSAFAEWTERTEGDGEVVDYAGVGLRGRWTHELSWGDRTSLTLSVRDHLDEVPDTTWTGASLGLGYDWGEPVMGLRLGAGAEVEWRGYDSSFLEPAGREDLRGTLRATVGLPRWEVWGFEPTVTLEASRTDSDADRIDKESLTLDLGLRSSF